MSTQITVRLSDELVVLVDELVATGRARSRASVVERALARELRRHLAERDVAILRGAAAPDDLDDLARWAAGLTSAGLD